MKLVSTLFVLFFSVWSLSAQTDIDSAISSALAKGDGETLSSYFNDNIELVIGTTNDVYSKKQAGSIVTDFFRKNKVAAFKVLHKGSKENSSFLICSITSGISTYRVYVLVRRAPNNKHLIQQLRIESSND